MNDNEDRAGLGKVIYSVDDRSEDEPKREKKTDCPKVEEADEESFPASDPPGYAGGAKTQRDLKKNQD